MRPEFSHAAWAERARHAAWREAWRLQGLNEPWDRRPTRSLSSRRHHSHGHHRFGGQGAGGRAAHAQQNGRWSAPTSGRQADCCSASNRRSRNLPAVTVSSGLWGTRTFMYGLRRGDIPTGGNLTKVSTYSIATKCATQRASSCVETHPIPCGVAREAAPREAETRRGRP
jgi:hypothetical protein